MATRMRKTGIDVVGDMPWGTHFCLFYDTKQDLLDILVTYCEAGLKSEEFCLWVVAEPLTIEEAINALKDAVPLVLSGEQGSAKSTFSELFRALIDPNTAPLRALSREDRDGGGVFLA
jgi:hypothetical protein